MQQRQGLRSRAARRLDLVRSERVDQSNGGGCIRAATTQAGRGELPLVSVGACTQDGSELAIRGRPAIGVRHDRPDDLWETPLSSGRYP